jgi:sugar phosphate isomerase/epimerase
MEFGVFARTWARNSPFEVAQLARAAGFTTLQWNFAAIGRSTLDANREPAELGRVLEECSLAGVDVWGLSATYNILFPGEHEAMAVEAIRAAGEVGVRYVTVCTGTNDPENMWRFHPDNERAVSWARMRRGLDPLLQAANDANVVIGIEPERANIVADAPSARRLLNELGHDAPVGIVLDPANLLTIETLQSQDEILAAAFADLGRSIVCVHAKDVVPSGYAAAGVGGLDYGWIAKLHREFTPTAPIISQDSSEADAGRVFQFLESAFSLESV